MNRPQDEPKLLDHEADGIRELDNQLPRWWVWLFYITIAWSAAYLLYFHGLSLGALQAEEFDKDWEQGEKIKSAAIARFEQAAGALQPSKDSVVLAQGRQQFGLWCAPCHRADGGGLVGPNLCDDYWIHGSNYVDNIKTILNGVPEKGMLSWRGVLKPGEMQAVASFIYSLRGSNPANPKPREDQASAQPAVQFE